MTLTYEEFKERVKFHIPEELGAPIMIVDEQTDHDKSLQAAYQQYLIEQQKEQQ